MKFASYHLSTHLLHLLEHKLLLPLRKLVMHLLRLQVRKEPLHLLLPLQYRGGPNLLLPLPTTQVATTVTMMMKTMKVVQLA